MNPNNKHHVIVWDPEDIFWEGSLVGPEQAQIVRGRGGAALPADASLFQVSGVGGYMRRGWGAGWPLEAHLPRMICPLSLYLTPDHRALHWVARLVPDEQTAKRVAEIPLDTPGTLQIMSYSPRSNSFKVPVTPRTEVRRVQDLGKVDTHGGWNVAGEAAIHPAFEGVGSFGLYGCGAGLRVAWAAVSATIG